MKKIFDSLFDGTPGIRFVEIQHDSWCPAIYTGIGCICNPDIVVSDEKTFIDAIGKNRAARRKQEEYERSQRKRGA